MLLPWMYLRGKYADYIQLEFSLSICVTSSEHGYPHCHEVRVEGVLENAPVR